VAETGAGIVVVEFVVAEVEGALELQEYNKPTTKAGSKSFFIKVGEMVKLKCTKSTGSCHQLHDEKTLGLSAKK
jgi:hypothetical protein